MPKYKIATRPVAKLPEVSKRTPRYPMNRLPPPKEDDEQLTGMVNGVIATPLEERAVRACKNANKHVVFQVPVITAVSLPHKAREVDLIVDLIQPVEIDGEYAHRTAEQKNSDEVRDMYINEVLQPQGMLPIKRIPGWRFGNQEIADQTIRNL
jgi:hypothetical protein